MLRVREIEQLCDAAETLSRVGRISGEQLTILTNGGGAGVLFSAISLLMLGGFSLDTPRSQVIIAVIVQGCGSPPL